MIGHHKHGLSGTTSTCSSIRTLLDYSGGAPLVSVMQPAQHRNPAKLWRLNRSVLRTIFVQCQVNAVPMIIVYECPEVPVQASLVEHDQVIQALAAKRPNDPFHLSSLPRGPWC